MSEAFIGLSNARRGENDFDTFFELTLPIRATDDDHSKSDFLLPFLAAALQHIARRQVSQVPKLRTMRVEVRRVSSVSSQQPFFHLLAWRVNTGRAAQVDVLRGKELCCVI